MAQINPTTLVNCVVLVLCYPKVFLEKKRNMFVLKFGYTPYTLILDGRFQGSDLRKKVETFDFHFV